MWVSFTITLSYYLYVIDNQFCFELYLLRKSALYTSCTSWILQLQTDTEEVKMFKKCSLTIMIGFSGVCLGEAQRHRDIGRRHAQSRPRSR